MKVKDFAKALKTEPSVLLERMQSAGLSHKSESDDITPSDKQALLLFLKDRKSGPKKVVTTSDGDIKAKPKSSATKKTSSGKSFTDNIEAKRKAAAEQLKEQQKKREDQIKEAIRLKQEQAKASKKPVPGKPQKPSKPVDVKDQLSKAANEYARKESSFSKDSSHQFEKPDEFIKKDIEISSTILVGELAKLMSIKGGEVVKELMSLGVMATINDSIDQETAILVTEEIGHNGVPVADESVEDQIIGQIEYSDEQSPRSPVVTVMGHVDHGKTSLLDYIRKSKVADGEAGGITQHIGAYSVNLKNDKKITFLDTPGHEAFTAMRARGTQLTDIVVIVIAADDDIQPQTKEAISHAQAAAVPIIIAINKIDRDVSNPEKIKEKLSAMNLLVEDWGGNIQSQDISALKGIGVDELLDKILLEAELLELKANPDKLSVGSVIEARLDKGKGYITTLLVQSGTLKIGDYVLAGKYSGKVKALYDERGNQIKHALPSTSPLSIIFNSLKSPIAILLPISSKVNCF